MRRLKGQKGDVQCLAFGPQGRTLATGSDDGIVRLWDVASGEVFHPFAVGDMLGGLAISPDGYNLVAGTWEGRVHGWILGQEPADWFTVRDQGRITSVTFAPDGSYLGWCGYRRVVVSKRGKWPDGSHKNPGFNQFCLRFSPDGGLFARGGQSRYVYVCYSATHLVCHRLNHGDKEGCWSVAFTPDGRTLILGLETGIQVWDVETEVCRFKASDQTDTVTSVAVSPDGTRLIAGSYDGTVSVYEFHPTGVLGRRLETFDWEIGRVFEVAVTADGTLAAAAGGKGVVLWDVE